jgi:surface antigen
VTAAPGHGTIAGVLLLTLLGGCVDRTLAERELQSLQARMRMGVGDIGAPQYESAAREASLPETARKFRPGDRFVYSDGRIETVVAAEGVLVVWNEGGGQSRTATVNPAFPYFTRTTGRYDRVAEVGGDHPGGLWPLGGGAVQGYNAIVERTERQTGETQLFRSRRECAVQAPATVETPLGPFTAMPVDCRYFSGRRLNPRGTYRYDMVPSLGYWVRHVETDERGVIEREIYLLAIEPGPWLESRSRRRIGELLRSVLETAPSGEVVRFDDRRDGLSGYVMATATFEYPDAPGRFCRAYSLTIATGDDAAVDYPGTSCRIDGRWALPDGF